MTKSASAKSTPNRRGRRRAAGGFTLIQLLVVIGILVLLIGFAFPAISAARRQAARTRQALDLQAITTALDEFKLAHGEYPSNPFLQTITLLDSSNAAVNPHSLDVPLTGSELLGYFLLGPGPARDSGVAGGPFSPGRFVTQGGNRWVCIGQTTGAPAATDTEHWWPVEMPVYWDNQDGAGFRARAALAGPDGTFGTADDVPQGKVFGPYLDATRFKTRGLQLLDSWGNPILYFPANPAKPNVRRAAAGSVPGGYIEALPDAVPPNPRPPRRSLWDASYAINAAGNGTNVRALDATPTYEEAFHLTTSDTNALKRFSVVMGDLNADGDIDTGETPVQKDYLLWSAGPDGKYGYLGDVTGTVDAASVANRKNMDDVTNFRE